MNKKVPNANTMKISLHESLSNQSPDGGGEEEENDEEEEDEDDDDEQEEDDDDEQEEEKVLQRSCIQLMIQDPTLQRVIKNASPSRAQPKVVALLHDAQAR
jgi:hypothetical protein